MRKAVALMVVLVLVAGAGAVHATVHGTYQGYPVVKVVVNGKELQPDVPAIIMDGRTLLPARAVAEALGARVDWDETSWTAMVSNRLSDQEIYEAVTRAVQPVEELMKSQLDAPKTKDSARALQLEALKAILQIRQLPPGVSEQANDFREWATGYVWSLFVFASSAVSAFEALESRNVALSEKYEEMMRKCQAASDIFARLYHGRCAEMEKALGIE